MLRSILSCLGCRYVSGELQRFYGVRYQRKILTIFGKVFIDRWEKVGWSDGTEAQMFPPPSE